MLLIGLALSAQCALSQEWLVDFDEATAQSKAADKRIMLVFKGSDWCAPCIKLEREILDTEIFKSYAEENLILLEADFPRRKANKLSSEQQEKNNQLAEKYNQRGFFPLVVVLNAEGRVLGQAGYQKISPKEFTDLIASF